MDITAIADTHCQYNKLKLDGGDILIHAGDIDAYNSFKQVSDFITWFSSQQYTHKILVAGNHDLLLEYKAYGYVIEDLLSQNNIIYLNNSAINIDGIKFYGSPITPEFNDWAFMLPSNERIEVWKHIPPDTDVLITHGPPYSILDKLPFNGEHVGCMHLLARIAKIKPKFHVFGHIHEGYGVFKDGDTTFINASVLDGNYNLANKPINFKMKGKKK